MTTKTMTQESTTAQDVKKIKQLIEEIYPANVRTGDPVKYASIFSEEALWMPPGAPDRQGQKGVSEGISVNFQQVEVDPNLITDEIEIVGSDMAYALGKVTAELRPKDGLDPMTVKMRAMWLLRREDSEWKIFRQIWNNKP